MTQFHGHTKAEITIHGYLGFQEQTIWWLTQTSTKPFKVIIPFQSTAPGKDSEDIAEQLESWDRKDEKDSTQRIYTSIRQRFPHACI